MEQILKTLQEIGVQKEVIDAIRAAGDLENALILMLEDDRHEYMA